jgi:hypothetical protein
MAADADVDEEGRIIIFARLACAIIMTVHHDGITMALLGCIQRNATVDDFLCLFLSYYTATSPCQTKKPCL